MPIIFVLLSLFSITVSASERITNVVCGDRHYRAHLTHYTGVMTGWHKMTFNKVELWDGRAFAELESSEPSWVPGVSASCLGTVSLADGVLNFDCYRAIHPNSLSGSAGGIISVKGAVHAQVNGAGHLLAIGGVAAPVTLLRRMTGETEFWRLSGLMTCEVAR